TPANNTFLLFYCGKQLPSPIRHAFFSECLFPPLDFYCDHGDVLYGSFCYFFGSWTASWRDAEDYCFNVWKGHLASFHSIEEVNFLKGDGERSGTVSVNGISLWTGGYSLNAEEKWKWSDGSKMEYIRWSTGEPEDDKPVQRCLSWNLHSHRWKEDNCGSDRGFICKMR
uniref:C-type lectin domain-containing protein n=1 Tax=Hippocampus comes TaxID=109280 RepID=A0A3Q2Z6P5_HIPCM